MAKSKFGYKESFIITFIIVLSGFVIEYLSGGKGVVLPGFPYNFYILVGFMVYIIATYKLLPKATIRTLTDIPMTVASISGFTLLVLLMGFLKQDDTAVSPFVRNLGLSHINRSWPYMLSAILLLYILGLVTLKRLNRFTWRNVAFFFNHFGLWLVIAAASLGTGDFIRFSMPIDSGEISNLGVTADNTFVKTPFTIKLNKFTIKTYPSELVLFDPSNRMILNNDAQDYSVAQGKVFKHNNLEIKILQYLTNAQKTQNGFVAAADSIHGQYAALIQVTGKGINKKGWISSGNYQTPATVMNISHHIAATLNMPPEKEYISNISIIDKDTTINNIDIKVNKPYKYKGFKIYQQSYDESKGRWATTSVLELVRDPWLPVVYSGFIMLIVGSIFMFWLGKK